MKENEIRPQELLQEYLQLVKQDAEKLDRSQFEDILCPACKSNNRKNHIRKLEYTYVLCEDCGSLYCNPRPSEKTLEEFYRSAESSQFWSNVFFPKVAEARREKLFRPKAEKIYQLLVEKNYNPKRICDVGSGFGIFLEELKPFFLEAQLFGIEPSESMTEISRKKGIETLNATAENSGEWAGKFDLVISSEVVEHVYSVEKFIQSISKLVQPNGYCLLTGLGYEGFDILTLQENSNSIFPPHHLNFLSKNGFETVFKNSGFIEVDYLTPGKLDIDIVLNSNFQNEFLRVLQKRGENAIQGFQKFLQDFQLSSHVWVFAKKGN